MTISKNLIGGMFAVIAIVVATAAILSTNVVFADDDHDRGRTESFAATQHGVFFPVDDPDNPNDDNCAFLVGPSAFDTTCTFVLEGSGSSNVMGDYTETATWVVSVPPTFTPGTIVSGSATLSSDRGDIHLEVIGPVTSLDGDNGIITPPQPFKIVGGTKRFEGATGSIVRSGVFSLGPLPSFDIAYFGAINYRSDDD